MPRLLFGVEDIAGFQKYGVYVIISRVQQGGAVPAVAAILVEHNLVVSLFNELQGSQKIKLRHPLRNPPQGQTYRAPAAEASRGQLPDNRRQDKVAYDTECARLTICGRVEERTEMAGK